MGFISDFNQLIQKSPRLPINSMDNENSPYVNGIHVVKNSYYCFDGGLTEDSAYCYFPYKIRDCFDCDYSFESELCYECVDCQKCYGCGYCESCQSSCDLQFCVACNCCHDCFGCINLQHESYCIFNHKYSKDIYLQKIKKLQNLNISEVREKIEIMKRNYPRAHIHNIKSENCPYGNFVTNCANSYWIFDGVGDEDCAYVVQSKFCKDSFDLHQSYKNELCYEGHTSMSYGSSHFENCSFLRNCHYMFNSHHCEYCWGCVNLNNAKYCILNQQFQKDKFFQKTLEIKSKLGWPLNP